MKGFLRVIRSITVLMLSLLVIVSSSWVADGLNGSCILEPVLGDCVCSGHWQLMIRTAGAFIIFVLATFCLYSLAKSFVPVRHLAQVKVKPHAAMIMPISSLNPVPEENNGNWIVQDKKNEEKKVTLSGDLAKDIEAFDSIEMRWNGQQLLRALAVHRSRLHQVVLIGSEGDRGSFRTLSNVKNIIRFYLPDVLVEVHQEPVDFEDIEALQSVYERYINDFLAKGVSEKEIILDATGGQKTTSIAAALTTLRWKRVEFQYIQTGGNKEALAFNVVVESPEKAGI